MHLGSRRRNGDSQSSKAVPAPRLVQVAALVASVGVAVFLFVDLFDSRARLRPEVHGSQCRVAMDGWDGALRCPHELSPDGRWCTWRPRNAPDKHGACDAMTDALIDFQGAFRETVSTLVTFCVLLLGAVCQCRKAAAVQEQGSMAMAFESMLLDVALALASGVCVMITISSAHSAEHPWLKFGASTAPLIGTWAIFLTSFVAAAWSAKDGIQTWTSVCSASVYAEAPTRAQKASDVELVPCVEFGVK